MKKSRFLQSYGFIILMLLAIVAGSVTGWVWPGATKLEPLGSIFINLMFCIVVPMVFVSISSAIANMGNRKRAGKIIGTTILTFIVTGVIASVLTILVLNAFPPVTHVFAVTEQNPEDIKTIPELIVSFFTAEDFYLLLSRRAMLPLIVASILFGVATNMCGGKDSMVGKLLNNLSEVLMKLMKIVMYYAPIGFFGFFAYLVATYGPDLIGDYSRALIIYYVFSFVYMFASFPVYARFGGGKGGAKMMFKHLFKPAVTSFGTCSSVATIPVNLEEAEATGISKDVADMVVPLGATMHMDGSCISAILKVIFLFGFFGRDLSFGTLVLAVIVAVTSAVAMSGVPGGGGVGEFVLCSLFFSADMAVAYPIAVALGYLVDPPATMVNSAGDYVVCYIVSRFVDGKDWLKNALAKKHE